MKKLFQKLDPAYLKVALYAGGTVLVTYFVGLALYSALPALSKFSSLVLAVLRPMLVGFVIWYLLLPAVKKIEGALAKRFGEKKGLRGIAVLICFLVILAVIAIFLIVISQAFVSQINFSSIVNLVQGTETDLQEFINQAISYLERFNIKIPNIGSSLTGVVSSIASSTTTFFFGVIFSIYFGSCKSGVDEEIKINSETLGHGTEECAMSFVIETDHSVSYKKDSDLE